MPEYDFLQMGDRSTCETGIGYTHTHPVGGESKHCPDGLESEKGPYVTAEPLPLT